MARKILFFSFIFLIVVCGCIVFARMYNKDKLPQLPKKYQVSVLASLDRAGENKGELIKALRGIRKDRLPGMCDVVSRMPQYDLVNINAQMLLDNVNSAFDTNEHVPWRLDTNSRVFLDYVLPYRVTNESLENSRIEVKNSVMPLIAGCRTIPQAVSKIISFSIAAAPPGENHIGSAYPYDYAPVASLKFGRLIDGLGCRAQCVFDVAALRAVGIPARHLEESATATSVSDHSNIVFYDFQDKKWHPRSVDDYQVGTDKGYAGWQKLFGQVTVYAKPPYVSKDLLGKQLYDKLDKMDTFHIPSGFLKLMVTNQKCKVADAKICVYIWCDHSNSWYPVFLAKTNSYGKASIALGDNQNYRPYMVSVSKDNKIAYDFVTIRGGVCEKLSMDLTHPADNMKVNVKATKKMGE